MEGWTEKQKQKNKFSIPACDRTEKKNRFQDDDDRGFEE